MRGVFLQRSSRLRYDRHDGGRKWEMSNQEISYTANKR